MKEQIQHLFEKQKSRSLQLRSAPIRERKEKLIRLRSWLLDNKARIRQAVFDDLRKSGSEVDIVEIFTVTSELNKALRNLSHWSKPASVSPGLTYLGTSSHIQAEPKGVCLIIAPWNFPFQLVCAPLVSCIAAGNTAILKPSENTPATSRLIKEMAEEIFDPADVAVVEGAVEETTVLLSLPFDHIFFTGSTGVGKIVMQAAAKHLSSVTLELGGKSPTIIDETADLKDAAKKIAWGKFLNNGQTCIAPDYVLIHESKKEAFIDLLKKNIHELFDHQSLGIQKASGYSRIVNDRHAQRMVQLLEEARNAGAKIETGGNYELKDRYFEPTVVSNFKEDTRIWKEEIFGPILPIQTYSSLDQVIKKINAGDKPLALYLFSQKKSVQKKIAQTTSSGSMGINDVVIQFSHPNLPFGGVNHSGLGKSHGYHGFLSFSNQKSIMKQRIGWTEAMMFYPPYSNFKKWVVGVLIRWI